MPSKRRPGLPLPLTSGTSSPTVTPPPINVINPSVARYYIYVRDSNLQLLGELDAFNRAEFILRFNAVSDWSIDLDAAHPMAGYLATRGNGISVNRAILDAITGVQLSSSTLLSGPIRSWRREKKDNKLIVGGKDDMAVLAARDAYPVTFYPYQFEILNFASCSRLYKLNDNAPGSSPVDSKSGQTGTKHGTITFGQASLIDDSATCALFSGAAGSGYITIPTTGLPTGNAPWTLTCWAKPASSVAGGSGTHLINMGNAGTNLTSPHIAQGPSGGWYAGTWNGDTIPAGDSTAGTVHFIVGVWDGAILRCYVDAIQVGSATPGPLNVTQVHASIGGAWNGSAFSLFFSGDIMNATIHSGAMSASDVLQAYTVGQSRFAHQAYDTRTGVAETIMRDYVNDNCVAAINDPEGLSRVVPLLTLPASGGLGSTITGNARFDPLVNKDGTGLLQSLALQSNPPLGFKVEQVGSSLEYRTYVPVDKTGSVIFSDDLGDLSDFVYEVIAPDLDTGGNQVVVGGGGQGTGRIFRYGHDAASIAAWGRAEGFGDARDTTDIPTLLQRVIENLAKFKETTSFSSTLMSVESMAYGIDFNLGDTVTVTVDGLSFEDIVREVDVLLDAQGGETVTPSVGTPTNAVPLDALDTLARQLKLAQAQLIRLMRVQ